MRTMIALFLLVTLAVVVTLCVQNDEHITLTFLTWSLAAPLWLVVLAGCDRGAEPVNESPVRDLSSLHGQTKPAHRV